VIVIFRLDPARLQMLDQVRTPAQCRAARALLNWSQEELVRQSKITKKTIADFERGATTPRLQTLAQIIAAFEAIGIEFLDGNRPGVRLDLRPCPS
jgi:transcriptional regulator with XRE-family HTH domain